LVLYPEKNLPKEAYREEPSSLRYVPIPIGMADNKKALPINQKSFHFFYKVPLGGFRGEA
jgi:hypothetical protein